MKTRNKEGKTEKLTKQKNVEQKKQPKEEKLKTDLKEYRQLRGRKRVVV